MTQSRLNRTDFQKAAELIAGSANCLVTTHTKPDGDACGCLAAISEALAALGKRVTMLLLSPLPDWYAFLFPSQPAILGGDISKEDLLRGKLGKFDFIIIVDTDSRSQLPTFADYLKQVDAPVLVIDHHKTSDHIGDVEIADHTAAAASLILLDFLKFARWPITPTIAQALFTGIATDTGWFRFNNTDASVLRSCAELIDAGANPPQIYHNIYQSFSAQRLALMTAMLNSLRLHFNGRFATQYLTQQDFKTAGARHEDTENLIDECQRIATVEVSALFVELPDGRIRCSLRSRGPVDVCKIAQKFDGGGHPSAAGAYLPGPIDSAKNLILAEVEERLRK